MTFSFRHLITGTTLLTSTQFAFAKTERSFILAEQSKMEGKARNSLLDFQATDEKTQEHCAHLRDGDKWAARDGTFIKLLGRKGPLTITAGPDEKKAIQALKDLGAVFFQHPKSKRVSEVKLNAIAKLKDADLALFSAFSELTDLSLEETKISGDGLKHIAELEKIEWLNLWDTKVDDKGLAHLKKLTALESLPVGRTAITDAGLLHLEKLPQLAYLGLRDTAVTDTGIKHLAKYPALTELNLRGTKVTDECIATLIRMKKLRKVWFGETKVSNGGVARLMKALPKCSVSLEDQ